MLEVLHGGDFKLFQKLRDNKSKLVFLSITILREHRIEDYLSRWFSADPVIWENCIWSDITIELVGGGFIEDYDIHTILSEELNRLIKLFQSSLFNRFSCFSSGLSTHELVINSSLLVVDEIHRTDHQNTSSDLSI